MATRSTKAEEESGFFVETMYGAKTKQPLVKISYNRRELCMINPKEAVLVAINLIQAANASITDAFLFEFMGEMGLETREAVQMMADFRNWRIKQNYDLGDDLIQGERRNPR